MPLAYCTMAPGDGQAFRQPGSSQCMQPSLRISHSRSPLGFSYSVKRITVQDCSLKSCGIVVVPGAGADVVAQIVPFHARDLAGLAADALGGVDELGDLAGMRAAHLRVGQRGGRAAHDVERLQCHLSLLAFSTLTRKDLNSGVCVLASPTDGRQRIGEESRLGHAHEAPVDRHADGVQDLAVDGQGPDALGHHRHRLDVAAVRTHLDPLAGGDADFLASASPISTNCCGCMIAVQARVLGPVSESARSADRSWPHAGTWRPCRTPRDRRETRAPPDCWSPAAGRDSSGL